MYFWQCTTCILHLFYTHLPHRGKKILFDNDWAERKEKKGGRPPLSNMYCNKIVCWHITCCKRLVCHGLLCFSQPHDNPVVSFCLLRLKVCTVCVGAEKDHPRCTTGRVLFWLRRIHATLCTAWQQKTHNAATGWQLITSNENARRLVSLVEEAAVDGQQGSAHDAARRGRDSSHLWTGDTTRISLEWEQTQRRGYFVVKVLLRVLPAKVWNMESFPKAETLNSFLSGKLLRISKR